MKLFLRLIPMLPLCVLAQPQVATFGSESKAQRISRFQNADPEMLSDKDWRIVIADVRNGVGTNFLGLLTNVASHPDSKRFTKALYYIGQMGPASTVAVPVLIRVLTETTNSHVRYDVAKTIGEIGPNALAAVPTLIDVLKHDSSVAARNGATLALGRIGKPSKDSLPLLEAQLSSNEPILAILTLNALARISTDPKVYVDKLVRHVDVPQRKNEMNLSTIDALETFTVLGSGARNALPVIEKQLGHPNSTIRELAIKAIGAMGDDAQSTLPKLESIAGNEHEEISIRLAAVRTISQIQGPAYNANRRIAQIQDAHQKRQEAEWAAMTRTFEKFTSKLPKVTKVQVSALLGSSDGPDGSSKTTTFPVRPYKEKCLVSDQRIFEGDPAEAIARQWRNLDFGWQYQALCHEPVYGLRFYSGRKLLLETTICWHCSNFYVGKEWCGFKGDSESGQALLKRLKELVPHSGQL